VVDGFLCVCASCVRGREEESGRKLLVAWWKSGRALGREGPQCPIGFASEFNNSIQFV